MLEIGTILGVVGILITIILSDPVIRWYRRWKEDQERERWSADLQVDEAQIPELKHYAYEYWEQEITVDSSGNAEHRVAARIINIGDKLLEHVTFPVYCDATNVAEAEVQPWAACGRSSLPAQVEDWIPERARGRVAISIVPPLPPGERRKIRWGYKLPHTFRPGDEYYNWDIATPHYEIRGKIRFCEPWVIKYLRWDSDLAASQVAPTVKNGTIQWSVRFPELGKRITIRFGLAKKGTDANKPVQATSL
jgi:hypothetical protein